MQTQETSQRESHAPALPPQHSGSALPSDEPLCCLLRSSEIGTLKPQLQLISSPHSLLSAVTARFLELPQRVGWHFPVEEMIPAFRVAGAPTAGGIASGLTSLAKI